MANVVVNIETMSIEGKSSFASDTSFWTNLWDNYTNNFLDVVIHCWKEEEVAIAELNPIAVSTISEGLIKVITVNLNDENRAFFRNHSIDPRGGLKWFKMFFSMGGDEQLEVGHYGAEIILFKVDKVEADKFVTLFTSSATSSFYDENAD